jgi:thymidylate kinase
MVHDAQIVTFSGIDGAGKTTQIESISRHLQEMGYRVARVGFWDDVAVLAALRANVSLSVLRRRSVDHSDRPFRSDKNVRTWYLMLVRSGFYLLDTLKLRRIVSQLRIKSFDFIIFDRYIFDELVHIRGRHWATRLYRRILIALAPKPCVGFVLDVAPDEAFSRKPEYPLAFLHQYRRSYLDLCHFVPQLVIISPGSVDDVHRGIVTHLLSQHEAPEADLSPAPEKFVSQ